MIELTRASFQYENSDRGVQDISLSVKSGECVVLTGLSGCGKTTVTRLVNGLAPSYYPGAFSGSVRIDGKDISRLSTWEIGRLVGSVFQDPKSQFFSSELAGEVAFPCENYGLSTREIRERTDAAIEALKLSRLRDRAVDVLSSGEKQRAAIASVYAMKPKVFVCDEPTANLDAAGTRQLAQTPSAAQGAGLYPAPRGASDRLADGDRRPLFISAGWQNSGRVYTGGFAPPAKSRHLRDGPAFSARGKVPSRSLRIGREPCRLEDSRALEKNMQRSHFR